MTFFTKNRLINVVAVASAFFVSSLLGFTGQFSLLLVMSFFYYLELEDSISRLEAKLK